MGAGVAHARRMTDTQPPVDNVPDALGADRPSPEAFLAEVARAEPGWSARYGGIDGVISLTARLLEDVADMSAAVAAIRTTAIQEELRRDSATSIARRHGISRQAVTRAATARRARKGMTW